MKARRQKAEGRRQKDESQRAEGCGLRDVGCFYPRDLRATGQSFNAEDAEGRGEEKEEKFGQEVDADRQLIPT